MVAVLNGNEDLFESVYAHCWRMPYLKSMFGLFKKKNTGPSLKDLIWANEEFKWKGCAKLVEEDPSIILVGWFDESLERCKQILPQNATIVSARHVRSPQVQDKKVVLLEHYPIYAREQELIAQWHAKEILVLGALNEPLFRVFGGERITTMLERLGQNPEEPIMHSLVSHAISNAQKKIEEKVITEHLALSQEDWFRKNLPTPL